MIFYFNLFSDGSSMLEQEPQGDASVPIPGLDDESSKVIAALLSLESWPIAKALGQLYAAGVQQRQREEACRRR